MNDHSEQRNLAEILLGALGADGYALAGSGAIREHGLIDRPTMDVDLFACYTEAAAEVEAFSTAVEKAISALRGRGYSVKELRRGPTFFEGIASQGGGTIQFDIGLDYFSKKPNNLSIGPVIDRDDAVANKLGALYGRSELRDYLDVDSIRETGIYTDEELLELAEGNDAGFDRLAFAGILAGVSRLDPSRAIVYGYDTERLEGVKERLTGWADALCARRGEKESRAVGENELFTQIGVGHRAPIRR